MHSQAGGLVKTVRMSLGSFRCVELQLGILWNSESAHKSRAESKIFGCQKLWLIRKRSRSAIFESVDFLLQIDGTSNRNQFSNFRFQIRLFQGRDTV